MRLCVQLTFARDEVAEPEKGHSRNLKIGNGRPKGVKKDAMETRGRWSGVVYVGSGVY